MYIACHVLEIIWFFFAVNRSLLHGYHTPRIHWTNQCCPYKWIPCCLMGCWCFCRCPGTLQIRSEVCNRYFFYRKIFLKLQWWYGLTLVNIECHDPVICLVWKTTWYEMYKKTKIFSSSFMVSRILNVIPDDYCKRPINYIP